MPYDRTSPVSLLDVRAAARDLAGVLDAYDAVVCGYPNLLCLVLHPLLTTYLALVSQGANADYATREVTAGPATQPAEMQASYACA